MAQPADPAAALPPELAARWSAIGGPVVHLTRRPRDVSTRALLVPRPATR